jgi:O-antigen/teichoic acid export membrane protein
MHPSRVLGNSAALLLLDLLNKAIPFVVFPWVVRALGPSVYGRLGFAGAVAGFFSLLASPGFTAYALREAAKNPDRVPFLARHVLGARLVFAAGSFLLLVISTIFLSPRDRQTQVLVVLSGLSFVAASMDIQWVFAARSRMWVIAGRGAIGQLAYAGLILALLRQPADAWVVPAAAILATLVGTLLLWLAARRQYQIPWPAISPMMWRGFLPVCLTLGAASLMSLIYDQIDTVMLKYFREDKELGMYVAAYGLMAAAMSFPPILAEVFGPLLSESAGQDSDSEVTYLRWFGYAMVGLAVPIAVGGFILATPLTTWVLGKQYSGSETLFRWLMLTLIAGPAASFFGSQLIPNRREQKYLRAVLAGAVTNIALNLVFIPRFGAIAAALTTAFSQTVVAFLNYHFARDLPRPSLQKPIVLALPPAVLMGAGLLVMQRFYPLHVAVLIVCGATLYFSTYGVEVLLWKRAAVITS